MGFYGFQKDTASEGLCISDCRHFSKSFVRLTRGPFRKLGILGSRVSEYEGSGKLTLAAHKSNFWVLGQFCGHARFRQCIPAATQDTCLLCRCCRAHRPTKPNNKHVNGPNHEGALSCAEPSHSCRYCQCESSKKHSQKKRQKKKKKKNTQGVTQETAQGHWAQGVVAMCSDCSHGFCGLGCVVAILPKP